MIFLGITKLFEDVVKAVIALSETNLLIGTNLHIRTNLLIDTIFTNRRQL